MVNCGLKLGDVEYNKCSVDYIYLFCQIKESRGLSLKDQTTVLLVVLIEIVTVTITVT